ncbi:hypothetical protein V1478_000287 [Vespula squamosa]|uniref:Uncharacterized protein n=1 Tax=Vespula squamosa TaxID=30214 RepID=A0ABD2C529_VESSQ
MILLYYGNCVVPAHGQWCLLMVIDEQRCVVTINQSCFGYANSVQLGKQVQGDRAGTILYNFTNFRGFTSQDQEIIATVVEKDLLEKRYNGLDDK